MSNFRKTLFHAAKIAVAVSSLAACQTTGASGPGTGLGTITQPSLGAAGTLPTQLHPDVPIGTKFSVEYDPAHRTAAFLLPRTRTVVNGLLECSPTTVTLETKRIGRYGEEQENLKVDLSRDVVTYRLQTPDGVREMVSAGGQAGPLSLTALRQGRVGTRTRYTNGSTGAETQMPADRVQDLQEMVGVNMASCATLVAVAGQIQDKKRVIIDYQVTQNGCVATGQRGVTPGAPGLPGSPVRTRPRAALT
jgi:hypothetical protein